MAEVDFGDTELFPQLDDSAPPVPTHIRFTDDEEEQDEASVLRSRLEECDSYIQRLIEENKRLQRKMKILSRPSGITVDDANMDGPVLQILYSNNSVSKQFRQEIEDCICSVILKHQKPASQKNKPSHLKPQNSAVVMDEESQTSSSSSSASSSSASVRTTTEAFKVVGSVLYFTSFSVDKLGQPLLNENPQMTEGWEVPAYHQVFNQVIGTDGQEIEMKDKRPKSMCFNCGSAGHQVRDCPKPKDMAAINERRKEFNQNSQPMQSNQRYHADEVEERFSKYKPGVMSGELLTALGIDGNTLPPLIYRMRQLGYPPGWLKEAEMENSGLTLYDGNASSDDKVTNNSGAPSISYDVSKLVDFPGFNVAASHQMKDEFMHYGSIPMQSNHMKQNFAVYLSNNFAAPNAVCNKRRHESDSSQQQRKKMRSSPDKSSDRSSDMDVESDPGTSYNSGHGDFQFQPPLPPGSPCFSSPPPLPHGTPPATPTPPPLPKGTPPPTPTNGSPALQGHNCMVVDEGTEDDLTLEELEEQQRLIWAALENTASNSDCDTPATGTPVASSPSVSTSAHVDTETEDIEEPMVTTPPAETCHSSDGQRETGAQDVCPRSPGAIKAQDESPQSPGPVRSQDDSPQSPGPVKSQDDSTQSSGLANSPDDSPQSPGPVKSQDDNPQSPDPVKSQDDNPQSPGPVKSQDDNPQSPGPVKSQGDSPQSPGPVKSQNDSPQSPGPVKSQDDSPQSPGPVKSQDDSPQSPGPVKSQDDTPQSPGPVKSQDDSPQSPGPVKSQDDSPQSPGPVKSQDDSPQSPGPVKSQDDNPRSPGPVKSQDDNPQSPDPDFSAGGAECLASPKHGDRITAVPHRSKFAAGIVPFEDTPEYTEVAEATGTYLRIRDLLKRSPRSLPKKSKNMPS